MAENEMTMAEHIAQALGVNDDAAAEPDEASEAVEAEQPQTEPRGGETDDVSPAESAEPEETAATPADTADTGEPPAADAGESKGEDAAATGDDLPLSERAKARFQALTESNRQLSEEVTGLRALRDMMNDSISSPDEFVTLLDFAGAMKRGDFKTAASLYQAVGQELQLRSGLRLDVISPLADFPDLQKQVDDFQLTEAAALELAQYRRQQQRVAAHHRQQLAEQQVAQQQQQRSQAATQSVVQWLQTVSASDPDFRAKALWLSEQSKQIEGQFSPEQWLPALKLAYQGYRPPVAKKPVAAHQPLRPAAATPGKQTAQPTSYREAVMAALSG